VSNTERTERRWIPAADARRTGATRVVAQALGVAAGLLGLEHGFFETQQGNVAPDSVVINAIGPPCERATAWHGCEPAFTIVPSFLVTGVLAMLAAAVVLVWAAAFVQRKHGGVVLLLLTTALFLVGGGFFTLWYGVVAGIAGTRIGAPFTWWRAHVGSGAERVLAALWPWILIGYLVWDVVAWLIGSVSNEVMLRLTPVTTAATPVVLILILLSGFARDTRPETEAV
jgi:hypothetical protein